MLSSYTSIGQNHLHFDEINSTNLYANDLLSKTSPMDGTVITAGFQTDGKGQFGRIWASGKDENILLSIILYPDFLQIQQQFYLSRAISLGICDYLEDKNIENVAIKWPNDIYCGKNKISGILISNHLFSQNLKNSVVGIGLNLNQSQFPDTLPNAISLFLLKDATYDVKTETKMLLSFIEARYNHHLKTKKFDQLETDYHNKMYGINQSVSWKAKDGHEWQTASMKGTDSAGRIVLTDHSGFSRYFLLGEIEIVY